jgi:hypothetical protein
MSAPKPIPHRDVFESRTETQVRFEFAEQEGEIGRSARAYLAEKQSEREVAAASKRDAREEETLSIARKALDNSRRSNIIAIIAIICAATATISAAIIGIKFGISKP